MDSHLHTITCSELYYEFHGVLPLFVQSNLTNVYEQFYPSRHIYIMHDVLQIQVSRCTDGDIFGLLDHGKLIVICLLGLFQEAR